MDSSELFVVDLKDPQDNHDRLLKFLVCVTRKYNESRQCKQVKRSASYLLHPSKEQKIDAKHEINASLFFNAILYYVFSEAGLSAMMRDKKKRPYASNVLSALYRKSWTRECTPQRELIFKLVNQVCCTVLDQSDIEFAGFVERVLLPLYLGASASSGMPSYNGETGEYSQPAKNSILEWASSYWNAIILLDDSEGTGVEIKKRKQKVIDVIRKEERPEEELPATVSEASVASTDVYALAEDVTSLTALEDTVNDEPAVTEPATGEKQEPSVCAPTPQQLVDGFIGLFVQLQNSWSEEADSKWTEYIDEAESRLAYLLQLEQDLHTVVKQASEQVDLLKATAALFAQMHTLPSDKRKEVVEASRSVLAGGN